MLDIEEMPPGETVLEMKCRRCGDIVDAAVAPGVMFGQALCCGYGWKSKVFGNTLEVVCLDGQILQISDEAAGLSTAMRKGA